MAKRKPVLPEVYKELTILTTSKEEFKVELEKRIERGQEILDTQIQSVPQFEEVKQTFYNWSSFNAELLKQSFNNPDNEYKIDYERVNSFSFGLIGGRTSVAEEIQTFRGKITNKINNLKQLVEKLPLLKSEFDEQVKTSKNSQIDFDNASVFIVHGHDEEAQVKVARFIEKLGFKPIILHEQASSGRTIIEKIEEYSNVGFGIVLYTPCDIGGKQIHPPQLKPRARQNVVFEHGYLIGKIGRNNVCALVKGTVETPNDISGVVYVEMDAADTWHFKIAKELKSSGYDVDMNKI